LTCALILPLHVFGRSSQQAVWFSWFSMFLGIVHAQWQDDLANTLNTDNTPFHSDLQPLNEASDNPFFGNVLSTLLKRNGIAGNYRRLPRIKQQRIIPFYSYGNDVVKYRTAPRYGSRMRTPYFFTPWNTETYQPTKYLNRQVYGGYGLK